MKTLTFAIVPILMAVAFCTGEWRAGNIMDSIAAEHKSAPLPPPTIVDPDITETVKVFKHSHGTHKDCVREVKQITLLLANLLIEHKSFGTCQNDHDTRYAPIDYDLSTDAIVKFQKTMLKERCPERE